MVAGGVAGGQTIAISGSGNTLGLVGAGDYGSPPGPATVTYTDGTTESSHRQLRGLVGQRGDRRRRPHHRCRTSTTASGRKNQQVSLYYAAIPLQQGKTVRYLTLPDVSDGATSGTAAMHIFAIAIG